MGESAIIKIVKLVKSEQHGFGFSILGGAGTDFPPVIYEIIEDSPAGRCKEVEVGDVILEVDDQEVVKLTRKEVLKCLRLSEDVVTLKLKRDSNISGRIQPFLRSPHDMGIFKTCREDGIREVIVKSPLKEHPPDSYIHVNGTIDSNGVKDKMQNCDSNEKNLNNKPKQPKFEAYMMTGDLILSLSSTSTITGSDSSLPAQQPVTRVIRRNNSVPTSPNEVKNHITSGGFEEVLSSPEPDTKSAAFTYPLQSVRTSKSEDHLQNKDPLTAVDIDMDDDMTSSLNTLITTNSPDKSDRIVWTFNAPVSPDSAPTIDSSCSSSPASSSGSSSPMKSPSSISPLPLSPPSTSAVSPDSPPPPLPSSPMKPKEAKISELPSSPTDTDATISSSEMKEEEWILREDSTDTVIDECERVSSPRTDENKIVIQVKGPDRRDLELMALQQVVETPTSPKSFSSSSGNVSPEQSYHELRESEDEVTMLSDNFKEDLSRYIASSTSEPISEEESDIESLHSFHYSPKAVDIPSAKRLAKRLYTLDGFKKSDVSRHLSKHNEFIKVVAEEYLAYFHFTGISLDSALRKFLLQFSLQGETQERERVLVYFSKRFLDCNPGTFNSQDAVHTLTCAIMLLNTDLHGPNVTRRMACSEFIENLVGLNDGENFPRDVLRNIYQAIKAEPLQWAVDEECYEESTANGGQVGIKESGPTSPQGGTSVGHNPFLDPPDSTNAKEYKRGYVMRKCCLDANGKKTPFGKRGWKMFYCCLRDMVLYLQKDESGVKRGMPIVENLSNSIRIHHALATKAHDYTKKQHVFRLHTADLSEYLFQTSDGKELQSWVDTINLVAASLSSAPLSGAVGSQKRFQRPLLPSKLTSHNLRDQLTHIEDRASWLETEMNQHRLHPPDTKMLSHPAGSRTLAIHNHKEKDTWLQHELKRYKTYAFLVRSKLAHHPELTSPPLQQTCIGEDEEGSPPPPESMSTPPVITERVTLANKRSSHTDRYSYRAAIYRRDI